MGHATIHYRDISTGDHLAPPSTIPTGTVALGAPSEIGSDVFLFWNPPGGPLTKANPAHATLAPGSSMTAWYGSTGPGKILALAFSDGENKLLAQTPIDSVDPASAWSGGNSNEVSNQTNVTITAKTSIAGDSEEIFDGWFQFGDGGVSGSTLTVPAGMTSFAIASYRKHQVTIPETHRSGLTYVKVLAGITMGEGGIEQDSKGRIFIVHPDPQPWATLTPADQDLLLGLSVGEIGDLVNKAGARATIKKAGLELATDALGRLSSTETTDE